MPSQAYQRKAESSVTFAQPSQDGLFVDPREYFDEWLRSLENGHRSPQADSSPIYERETPTASIYLESAAGSDCQVSFEGVLQVEGHLTGNIHSLTGTLVMPEQGTIEADIEVGVALINGCVNGNISASQRVVLHSRARVEGNINTPLLSINDGAVFEGECSFLGDESEAERPKTADSCVEASLVAFE